MSRFDKLKAKAESQNDVMSYYDNLIYSEIINDPSSSGHILQLHDFLTNSKENRFCSYDDRIRRTKNKFSLSLNDTLMSQGTHSLINWKGLSVYKSAYDLVIYSMLLQEISPEVIIEYGSGSGGSAIWMADMLSVTNMNFKPDGKIYSYDIKKPECDHDMIESIELDLTESREWHWQEGRKLVIEDAHVNITEVLLQTDNMLESGDYLIVEDSGTVEKQKSISEFLQNAKNTYEIDQYYLDFFGMNVGSCVDSIFKVK